MTDKVRDVRLTGCPLPICLAHRRSICARKLAPEHGSGANLSGTGHYRCPVPGKMTVRQGTCQRADSVPNTVSVTPRRSRSPQTGPGGGTVVLPRSPARRSVKLCQERDSAQVCRLSH